MAGDNPNLVFYTMRFQNAKNVELYHVSSSKSSLFHIETITYGQQTFELENHFTSIQHLVEALSHLKNDSGSEVKLDVIVVGASSLQKLSTFPAAIKSAVTEQTKVFIESTGFIHLEPFIRTSSTFSHASVFSIMTDYDIRRVPSSVPNSNNKNSNSNSNTYRQFVSDADTENIRKKYSIYLGTGTNSNAPLSPGSPYQGTKNKSYAHTQTRYTSETVKVLKSFEKLFLRLFPLDKIENCDYTYNEFLSKQWNLSLLRICLDPLLIIFEETNTRKLTEHILAKPLISGVITELITVARNMNIRLDSALDNENAMLVTWVKKYNGGGDSDGDSGSNDYIPPLVYNFVHRTGGLDIDLLLLQPILIADDYGIKTPYLEFMYTVLCQAERLNRGKSVWFTRSENLKNLKQQLSQVTASKEQLEETCRELSVSLDKKELQLQGVRENEEKLKTKLQELEKQLKTLKEAAIERAAAAVTTTTTATAVTPRSNSQVELTKKMEMMQLGSRASSNGQMAQPQMLAPATSNGSSNNIMASNIANNTSPQRFTDRAHDDRERQLQQRELELQEREADLEKRIQQQQRREQQIQLHVQTQQPSQQMPFNQNMHQSPLMYPNNSFNAMNTPGTSAAVAAATPTTNASVANASGFGLSSGGGMPLMRSRSSVAKLQSLGAPLHGPKMSHGSFSPPISAERFVDPIADGPSGIESPYEIPGARYQNMPYPSHQVKPTSRKYRKSHLPNIGSASSIDMNAITASPHLNQPGMGAHNRISSLPALQANGYPNNNGTGSFGGNNMYATDQTSNPNDTRSKYGSSTMGPDYLNPTRTKKAPTASPVLNASQRQVSSSTLGDTTINKSNSASTGSTTVDDPSSGISRGVIQFGSSAKPVDIGLGVSTSDSQPIKLNSAPYPNQYSNATPIAFNNESPVKEDTNVSQGTDNKQSKKKKKKFSIFNKK